VSRNYAMLIVRDPQICGGEPVVRGTRVPIRTILASLAEGTQIDQIMADFPTLSEEHVKEISALVTGSPYSSD
jgi:uncharacterized protein (DUF433 family)